jgi:hypothetical protein
MNSATVPAEAAIKGKPKTRRLGLRNFKPQVSLPKNGKPCSLERHYAGALRQYIGILDELASHDPERFVWATDAYLLSHCRKYREEKIFKAGKVLYSERIIKDCKFVLRLQDVISTRVQRERFGVLRWGVIVAEHDKIAHVRGKRCVLEGAAIVASQGVQNSAKTQNVAPFVAPFVAPHVAYHVAPQNEKRCIERCIDGCTPETLQPDEESGGCGQREKIVPGFDGGFAASTLLSFQPFDPCEPTAAAVQSPTNDAACAAKPQPQENRQENSPKQEQRIEEVRMVENSAGIAEPAPQLEDPGAAQAALEARIRWENEVIMRRLGITDPEEWERLKRESREKSVQRAAGMAA